MNQRTILHAADIHLDSPLRNLSRYEDAPEERIRGASRTALGNLVDLAIERDVDLVVIAGDLYDGDWPDQNTGLFFVSQASRLIEAGIPLAVIRGNHDAFNKMTLNLRLPKNPDGSEVMLSEKKVDSREFDFGDLTVAVHGRSYRKQHERGDLVKDYPKARGGVFNLGLLHTSLTGFEGHTAYAPCTPQQLADFGYDYWALGHIHQRDEHQVDGAAPVVFSGIVQGRKINEPGAKGCVLVDINARGQTTRTFEPLDVVRFELCRIDVAKIEHVDAVMEQFESWLETKLDAVDDRLLVPRIELVGQSTLHAPMLRGFESLEASFRSSAINIGGGQVWLEKVKLRTQLPGQRSQAFDSKVDRGAMNSLQAILADFQAPTVATDTKPGELFATDDAVESEDPRPSAADWVRGELSTLIAKLPKELTGDDGVLGSDRDEDVQTLLDQATAELMARLQHS